MPKKQKIVDTHTKAPAILLSKTQMGNNIGASARAMANFRMNDLRLITPRCHWPENMDAYALAAGANTILDNAQTFNTISEAVADCHFVCATTARPRDLIKTICTPYEAALELQNHIDRGYKVAILFGSESKGLDNEALQHAHIVSMIPVNPDFASLNLAQAVLLMAYEWFKIKQVKTYGARRDKQLVDNTGLRMQGTQLANMQELENFFFRLEKEISMGNFFTTKEKEIIMKQKIRNLFMRANITEQEVRILFGVMTALKRSGSTFHE